MQQELYRPKYINNSWSEAANLINTYRTKVFGGWIVTTQTELNQIVHYRDSYEEARPGNIENVGVQVSTVFIPDPEHKWDEWEANTVEAMEKEEALRTRLEKG